MSQIPPPMPGVAFRRFDRPRDYAAVAELVATANRHDGVDWLPTAEGLTHEWEHNPGFDPDRDVLLAEADETLIGLVDQDCRRRGEQVFHHLHPVVHPAWRARSVGRAPVKEARAIEGSARR